MRKGDREVDCGSCRDLDNESVGLLAVLDIFCSQYIECFSASCVNWKKHEN